MQPATNGESFVLEHCIDLSLYYAHQRGVFFVIEQPMTSVAGFASKAFHSQLDTYVFQVEMLVTQMLGSFLLRAGEDFFDLHRCKVLTFNFLRTISKAREQSYHVNPRNFED